MTHEILEELRLGPHARQFTEANLRAAWQDEPSENIAAAIMGFRLVGAMI